MSELSKQKMPLALYFTASFGVVYLIAAIIHILVLLGIVPLIPGMSDPFEPFLLIVIAGVFLTGMKQLHDDDKEGIAFLIVGVLLGGMIAALRLLVLSSRFIGWLFQLEDWVDWNIANELAPTLWLAPVLIIAFSVIWFTQKSSMELNNSSSEGP